jgi:glutamate synthase domain-containing protein 3
MNFDLNKKTLREVNQHLQNVDRKQNTRKFEILNPQGQHAICAGLKDDIDVTIKGHTGYYCAGMNQKATVTCSWKCWNGCCRKYDVRKNYS